MIGEGLEKVTLYTACGYKRFRKQALSKSLKNAYMPLW